MAIATTTTVARAEDFNLLLDAKKVEYRRAEEPKYYPALIGETYRSTDYLRVSTNGKALVICRNGSKWQVPADNQSHQIKQNCPSSPASRGVEERNFWQLLRDAFLRKALPEHLGSLRGDSDANVPYIITPRNTMILSDRLLDKRDRFFQKVVHLLTEASLLSSTLSISTQVTKAKTAKV